MDKPGPSFSIGGESSDSSTSSESSDEGSSEIRRRKRDLPYAVFAHALVSSRLQRHNASSFSEMCFGNPLYSSIMRLYCRTKFYLTMSVDGRVFGTQNSTDPNGIFKLTSAGQDGHVRIQSTRYKKYVAMNRKGRLYGELRSDAESTVWIEEMHGHYNTYMSRSGAHLGWYLAIKSSGKPKRGTRTGYGQKATMFLPRRDDVS